MNPNFRNADLSDGEVVGWRPVNRWVTNPMRRPMGNTQHERLQTSLARYLQEAEFITFTEIQINAHGGGGGARVDVVALKPSYSKLDIRAYEIKASRSDLLRGLNSPTWREYYEYCHRVIFAFPQGLAKMDEIPEECGIVTLGPNGWHHVRPGRGRTPPKLDHNMILALLFRGYESHIQARDLRAILSVNDGEVNWRALAIRAGHDIERRLQQTEHKLSEPLAKLQAAIESVFGIKLDDPHKVSNLTHRIELLASVMKEAEAHGKTLGKIGHYLGSFDSYWSDQAIKLREAVEGELSNAT